MGAALQIYDDVISFVIAARFRVGSSERYGYRAMGLRSSCRAFVIWLVKIEPNQALFAAEANNALTF